MFKDPILLKLYKKHGPHEFEDRSKRLLEELVESIISQQLSVKAADTIYSRFLALFGDKFPSIDQILKEDKENFRKVGMSYSKADYIKNVAQAFKVGMIDAKKITKMSDDEVIKALTQIKGIGKWTAEMILIFTLKRKDVFSLGDAGLKRAIKTLYKLETEKEILELTEKWKPNRSLASWYLWRSLENTKSNSNT